MLKLPIDLFTYNKECRTLRLKGKKEFYDKDGYAIEEFSIIGKHETKVFRYIGSEEDFDEESGSECYCLEYCSTDGDQFYARILVV